jgi:dienelactone hydrolase
MQTSTTTVAVSDGDVPVFTSGPADASSAPGLVVVPSIFGANDDLLAQMCSLADVAFTVTLDPFWREGGGPMPYDDPAAAIERLQGFDRRRCGDDIAAVTEWTRARSNGNVVALGICFGGSFVLLGAAQGRFCAGATWHGSRMETVLDRLDGLDAPLRLHFGEVDAITPPDVVDAVRARFRDHPDCRIVVHPGADHGFSHEGAAWDAAAAAAALADLRELLVGAA